MYESFAIPDDLKKLGDTLRQAGPKQVTPTLDPGLVACLEGVTPRFSRFKMRQLALVLKLVGTENLHEAAAALNMSQPAATKLLQEIEEALGAVLFTRQARGMKPTPAGILVARHAGFILAELRKMQQAVDGFQNGITGYVNIGAIMAAVPSPVTGALVTMSEVHPTVEVSLSVGTSDVLLHELQAGRLDFIIASSAGAIGAEPLTYSPLAGEPAVVVSGIANPILRQHDLTLKDVFSERWILPPAGAPELRTIEAAFHAAGLPLPVNSMRMASMIATATVVGTTDMLAVVPESMYRYFSKFQVMGLVDVNLSADVERYGLINVSSRPLAPAARALYELIYDSGRRSQDTA
ncbi:MAG: LysR family transcriptional regulator [Caulobacteraceae bacterium]